REGPRDRREEDLLHRVLELPHPQGGGRGGDGRPEPRPAEAGAADRPASGGGRRGRDARLQGEADRRAYHGGREVRLRERRQIATAVEIRRARPEDAAAVAEVHVRTWQVAYEHVF